MKEINIVIKYNQNQLGAEINTNGFNPERGMLNAIEIIGILENIKQQEINKLNESFEEG